jgi:hypothetical protein
MLCSVPAASHRSENEARGDACVVSTLCLTRPEHTPCPRCVRHAHERSMLRLQRAPPGGWPNHPQPMRPHKCAQGEPAADTQPVQVRIFSEIDFYKRREGSQGICQLRAVASDELYASRNARRSAAAGPFCAGPAAAAASAAVAVAAGAEAAGAAAAAGAVGVILRRPRPCAPASAPLAPPASAPWQNQQYIYTQLQ